MGADAGSKIFEYEVPMDRNRLPHRRIPPQARPAQATVGRLPEPVRVIALPLMGWSPMSRLFAA